MVFSGLHTRGESIHLTFLTTFSWPFIYTAKTDAHRLLQMCKPTGAHRRPMGRSRFSISSSCVAMLRPCIVMAVMMLHAALGPLKVNFLTSLHPFCPTQANDKHHTALTLILSDRGLHIHRHTVIIALTRWLIIFLVVGYRSTNHSTVYTQSTVHLSI